MAKAVARAQPTMAAVWNVCDRWLHHVERGSTPLQSARRIAQELSRAQRITAGRASALIRNGHVVVTYSSSSTIEATLRMARLKGRRFRVLCSEGRPMYEGRIMAQRLAAQAIPVDLFTDSGLLASLPGADLVFVGCDAIFSDSFLNKVGTHALLRMARIARVPAYIVADSFKFLPSAARPSFRIREENLSEVWKRAGKNLRIRNFYFEETPLRACSGLITEGGLWPAENVSELLRAMESGASLRYAQKRSRREHRYR
ncbi:MAG: hypothetical protein HYX73_03315 [Acidobacteria bacterium]|nr:hypothetical protein [Acidobacteriota bacterium]